MSAPLAMALVQQVAIMVRCSFFLTILFAYFLVGINGQYRNCTGLLNNINDGCCDYENNLAECGFDTGDCCDCSCTNDRLYPSGIWGYSCSDPDTVGNALGCENQTDFGGPCSINSTQKWFVNDTESATALAGTVNCSVGTFNVTWRNRVVIDRTIFIPEGTTVYMTGEGSGAEVNGGGNKRLFVVDGAVLHIEGLILSDGNATCGGAIAATRSSISLNQTTCSSNIASSYGGALYVSKSSSVAGYGQTTLVDNYSGRGGGAVAVSMSSTVSWNGPTKFSNNTAAGDGASGGAIFINGHSRVSWDRVTSFINNHASLSGGALYVGDNSIALWAGMMSFVQNTAGFGGAMFVVDNSIVSWTEETYYMNNNASFNEGAFLVFQNSTILWDGMTTFVENTAGFGGAIMVEENSSISWTAETVFSNNRASSNGGALLVHEESNASWDGATSFVENAAGFGGAMFVVDNSIVSWTEETYYMNNNASFNGGAFLVFQNSTILWDGMTTFVENTAGFGGAITVGENSSISWTAETVFSNNRASSNGGALLVHEESNASWDGATSFVENAAGFGGAVFIELYSVVSWDMETSFVANIADYGGAVLIEENSIVSWTAETSFIGNIARRGGGGALRVRIESSASWTGETSFAGNSANSSGGAIYAITGANITMGGDTHFLDNYAAIDGGAVFVYVGYDQAILSYVFLDDDVDIFIKGNDCGANGGGIAFIGALVTRLSSNMTFWENHAEVAGGAVYMSGVSFGPLFEGTKFYSNSAVVVGGVYATGSGIAVDGDEDEDLRQNPTTFIGCEFIGNKAMTTGGALNTGGGVDMIVNTSFARNTATTGGALRLIGAVFLAECEFMDNISEEDGGPGMSNDGVISGVSSCNFLGNVFKCDPGFYLGYNETSALFDTICKGCEIQCKKCAIGGEEPMCLEELDHSSAAGGNATIESLLVDPGYWRATNTSIYILACYNAEACVGGMTGKDGYCHKGYEGPYCSICKQGYTASLGFSCTKCSDVTGGIATTAVVAVVFLFTLIDFVSYMLSGKSEDTDKGIVARVARYIPLHSVKVVIVVWQILTQFSTVANVVFPSVYQDFLDSVDILNFDMSWVISIGCFIDTDFHDQLLFATLGPLVVMAILGCTYRAAMHRTDMSEDAHGNIHRKHVSMVLLLTFLVYSSVSSTLFKMFSCDDLDDGKNYLRVDYRIECGASKHIVLQIYAGFMVVLYVVGIPAFYGILLYNNREALVKKDGREEDDIIKPITDLWKPYQPDRFFYEVIECVRRVSLTGMLVFIFPNSAAQIAVALMITTLFIFISEALAPHGFLWDTWCSRTGHAIVFTSIFLALLLKVDVSGERARSQKIFEMVLLAAHLCLILIVVVESVAMVFSWREGVTEDTEPRVRPSLSVSSSSRHNDQGFLVEESPPSIEEGARTISGRTRSPPCYIDIVGTA